MARCSKGTLTRPHPLKQGTWQYLNTRCKKLSCPDCGPIKASQYRKAIFRLRAEHKLQRMVTLTLDPGLIPADRDSLEYIQQVWCRFRTFLNDKRKLKLTYIRTMELQENGTAHFHLLIHQTIAQDNLRKWWVECGGGHQCTISFKDGNRGAKYVTKYVSKKLVTPLAKGARRVATSHGLCLFEAHLKTGWQWNPLPYWLHVTFSFNLNVNELAQLPTGDYFEHESPPNDEASLLWAPRRSATDDSNPYRYQRIS